MWSHADRSRYSVIHRLGIVHTDLKPENILLDDSTYQTFTYNRQGRTIYRDEKTAPESYRRRRVLFRPKVCLIDFGCAVRGDQRHNDIVTTWYYRAPEVILRSGWSFPCDIWSVGCILVELYLGDALYFPDEGAKTTREEALSHLGMMQAVCGDLDGNGDSK